MLRWVAVLVSGAWVCGAQPKINSVSRDWIHRGATIEVTLAGEGLHSVTGLVFSGESGVSGALIEESAPAPALSIESSSHGISVAPPAINRDKSRRAKISVTADAPLGERELRAVAPDGISAPLTLTIGPLPEVREREPNNTAAQAQSVTLPAVIAGVIQSSTEVDAFRFQGKKGDQIVLEVVAQRAGSPLDSSLVILDATGKELARDEDSRGFDSLLEFTLPVDGEYVAQLRDFQFRGGGNYKYRLFAGVLPYVDYTFPFGGQRGKPVEVTLKGRNLGGTEKVTLNIAPDSPLGPREVRFHTPNGLSNPIQFDVQDVSEITETEPNNERAKANPAALPVMVNGRIGAPEDIDQFRFRSDKDQKLVCDIEARKFGSPLDALLILTTTNGSVIAQNDDASGPDARIEFDAKKDTDYVVAVRDLTVRGGEEFGYRLSIRPPVSTAGFVAKFYPDAVRLHRGARTHVRCEVARQGGFKGPVRIAPKDLPAGVMADLLIIPADRNEGDLLLSASSDAVPGTAPLQLTATAEINGKSVVEPLLPIAVAENRENVFKQGFLTVLDPAPFLIEVLTLAASTDQGQKSALEVMIERQSGFKGEVKLSALGFSSGREPITKNFSVKEVVVKEGETKATIPFTARIDSEVGTRPVLVRAEAKHGGETAVVFSRPVAVTVGQIPFVLSAAPAKVMLNGARPGATGVVDEASIKILAARRNFNGEIPLKIEGLPAGVLVEGTNITANAGEVAMKFMATDEAQPGTNYSFSVEGVAMHNDRLYRHKVNGIKLVISPPQIEIAATNATAAAKQP